MINSIAIKLKDGTIFPVGSECSVSFKGAGSVYADVTVNGRTFQTHSRQLARLFPAKFRAPTLRSMEKWMDEGIARSMLGNKVEPDGYDWQGSPSWMLVAGLI